MSEHRTTPVKETVQQRFSQVAANYRTSQVHASGEELNRMLGLLQEVDARTVLDAGCGPGHTALALAQHVDKVIGIDLSPQMLTEGRLLAAERNLTNVEFRQGDVEDLPFADATFDAVVSRYSAHHWPNPILALQNFRRVLDPERGYLLFADTVSFADHTLDTHLQTIELMRDPSHVRDHTPEQWIKMLRDTGFTAEMAYTWNLRIDFAPWIARMATPPEAESMIRSVFQNAPSEVQSAFQIAPDGSFTLRCVLLRASLD